MNSIIRGGTIEEKLASIEHALQHYRRRLSQKVVGVLSPVALVHYQALPDPGGTIYCCIVPLYGNLVRMCIAADQWPSGDFVTKLHHQSKESELITRLVGKPPSNVHPMDEEVRAGDILRVTLEPADGARNVLVGLLIIPSAQGQTGKIEYSLEQFLLLEAREKETY